MDDIPVTIAKDRLEDLISRAARGEDILITAPNGDTVRLSRVAQPGRRTRILGHLAGKIPLPPDDFFAPLSDEELADWHGADR
jgi:antitoxin (DNA-binding transcriptional repressor) of toxin-antitoxin stability system